VAVHQLVHLKVLVVVPEGIVEGLRHLQPTEVEEELQAAQSMSRPSNPQVLNCQNYIVNKG
jgi:hypothetical protein